MAASCIAVTAAPSRGSAVKATARLRFVGSCGPEVATGLAWPCCSTIVLRAQRSGSEALGLLQLLTGTSAGAALVYNRMRPHVALN